MLRPFGQLAFLLGQCSPGLPIFFRKPRDPFGCYDNKCLFVLQCYYWEPLKLFADSLLLRWKCSVNTVRSVLIQKLNLCLATGDLSITVCVSRRRCPLLSLVDKSIMLICFVYACDEQIMAEISENAFPVAHQYGILLVTTYGQTYGEDLCIHIW